MKMTKIFAGLIYWSFLLDSARADIVPQYQMYVRDKIDSQTFALEISDLVQDDDGKFWRITHISCVEACKNAMSLEENEIGTPVGIVVNGPEITTLWETASATWVKIFRISPNKIAKVLDQPTKKDPIFTRTKNGQRAIRLWSGSAGDDIRASSMSEQERRKFYDELTHTWVWNGSMYVEESKK